MSYAQNQFLEVSHSQAQTSLTFFVDILEGKKNFSESFPQVKQQFALAKSAAHFNKREYFCATEWYKSSEATKNAATRFEQVMF